jgi:hypothetical protein
MFPPVLKRAVWCHHVRAGLIAAYHHLEEALSRTSGQLLHLHVIDDQQVRLELLGQQLVLLAQHLVVKEVTDQVEDRSIVDGVPDLDRLPSNRLDQQVSSVNVAATYLCPRFLAFVKRLILRQEAIDLRHELVVGQATPNVADRTVVVVVADLPVDLVVARDLTQGIYQLADRVDARFHAGTLVHPVRLQVWLAAARQVTFPIRLEAFVEEDLFTPNPAGVIAQARGGLVNRLGLSRRNGARRAVVYAKPHVRTFSSSWTRKRRKVDGNVRTGRAAIVMVRAHARSNT